MTASVFGPHPLQADHDGAACAHSHSRPIRTRCEGIVSEGGGRAGQVSPSNLCYTIEKKYTKRSLTLNPSAITLYRLLVKVKVSALLNS